MVAAGDRPAAHKDVQDTIGHDLKAQSRCTEPLNCSLCHDTSLSIHVGALLTVPATPNALSQAAESSDDKDCIICQKLHAAANLALPQLASSGLELSSPFHHRVHARLSSNLHRASQRLATPARTDSGGDAIQPDHRVELVLRLVDQEGVRQQRAVVGVYHTSQSTHLVQGAGLAAYHPPSG